MQDIPKVIPYWITR